MLPYQERVAAERGELKKRIDALNEFIGGPIYPTLDGKERDRLMRQWGLMVAYCHVLDERIDAYRSAEPAVA